METLNRNQFPPKTIKPKGIRKRTRAVKGCRSGNDSPAISHPLRTMNNDNPLTKIGLEQLLYLKEKQTVASNLKECQNKLDAVRNCLLRTKVDIESVQLEQENIQIILKSCDSREEILKLSEDQLQKQMQLISLIDTEEKLIKDLDVAQQALSRANLNQQSFGALNEERDEFCRLYENKTNDVVKERFAREAIATKNAKLINSRNLKSWARGSEMKAKPSNDICSINKITFQESLKRIRKHMLATSNQIKEARSREASLKEMRQSRQYSSLAFLKKEIDDQKDVLWSETQVRLKRVENKARAETKRRKEMIRAGENPYVYEKMMRVFELEKFRKNSLLQQKQQIVDKISHELQVEEMSKARAEFQRKKWDKYWAKKAKEKRRLAKLKSQVYFADVDVEKQKSRLDNPCSESTDLVEINLLSETEEATLQHSFNFDVLKLDTQFQDGKQVGRKAKHEKIPAETANIPVLSAENLQPVHSKASISNSIDGESKSKSKIVTTSALKIKHEVVGGKLSVGQKSEVLHDDEPKKSHTELSEESLRKMSKLDHGDNSKVDLMAAAEFPGNEDTIYFADTDEHKQLTNANFKWVPEIVTFKDFELGKVYKKKVSVTNASLHRLKYYFKQLINRVFEPDSLTSGTRTTTSKFKINDMIQIDFQIPAPISPGLSHDFYLTFKPVEIGDFHGHLQFESESGSFDIPVTCLKKTFQPQLSTPKIFFHNIVVDTSNSKTLKLKNSGAKSGLIERIEQVNISKHTPMSIEEYLAGPDETSHVDEAMEHANEEESQEIIALHDTKSKAQTNGQFDVDFEANQWLEEIFTNVTQSTFVTYIKESKRQLDPGETVHLKVHFRPEFIGDFETDFNIVAEDSEVAPVQLQIEGYSMDYPVYAAPLNTNFKICMAGFNYQQPITLVNTSRFSGKIVGVVPTALKDYVEVTPPESQLFPNLSISMAVRFKPRLTLTDIPDIKSYFDFATRILDFPVYFYMDFPFLIPAPIVLSFQAVMVHPTLLVSPTEIELGHCSATETVRSKISITNTSLLPQDIGFVELPLAITVQPNYGFTTLLPNETREFEVLVSVSSKMKGVIHFHFKVQSLGREEHLITVGAFVRPQMLCIAHSRIYFPTTCCGSVVSTITEVYCTAPPRKTRGHHTSSIGTLSKFEFRIAPGIPIEIRPRVGLVEMGKRVKVVVSFGANVSDEQVKQFLAVKFKTNFDDENKIKLKSELQSINYLLSHKEELAIALKNNMMTGSTNLESSSNSESNLPRTSQAEGQTKAATVVDAEIKTGKKDKKIMKSKKKKKGDALNSAQVSDGAMKIKGKVEPNPPEKEMSTKMSSDNINNQKNEDPSLVKSDSLRKSLNKIGQQDSLRLEKSLTQSGEPTAPVPVQDKMLVSDGTIPSFQTLPALMRRRERVMKALQAPFIPPNSSTVVEALEFGKAKRELMKNMTTTSQSFTIPCFVTDVNMAEEVLLLNVNCPMQQPDLILLDESNVVDFGVVGIHDKSIKNVSLYNVSPSTLTIKMDLINPYGPFVRVNAIRKIQRDHVFNLKLKFSPNSEGFYEESVGIIGGESRLKLNLRGTAIKPEFFILPSKPDVYIGTIRIKTLTMYQFEVVNESNATLEFQMETVESGHYEGLQPVSVVSSPSAHLSNTKMRSLSSSSQIPTTPSAPPPSAKNEIESHIKVKKHTSGSKSKSRHKKSASALLKPSSSVSANKNDQNPSNAKVSSRKQSKSTTAVPKFEGTFEVEAEGTKSNLSFDQLIKYLELKQQDVFVQIFPVHLLVKAKSTGTFAVRFIPMQTGRYFCTFNVCLFGEVVQQFSVVGGGYDDVYSKNEDE